MFCLFDDSASNDYSVLVVLTLTIYYRLVSVSSKTSKGSKL